MTREEALEKLSGHSAVKRLTYLSSDENKDKIQRQGYIDLVIRLATNTNAVDKVSAWNRVKSLAEAAVDFTASGFETVSQEEFDRRHGICEKNDCGMYDKTHDKCLKCTCILSIKPWAKNLHCPLGFW